MKIKINQPALLAALNDCATVADARSAYPWGSCVILDACGGSLVCRASNGMQAVARTVKGVDGLKMGTVMVNAKDAAQRVAALDAGPVNVEELPGSVRISQGGARYNLPKLDPAGSPDTIKIEPQGGEVDARAFAALLARVAPAMGTLESQASTWGVSLASSGGKLWAQAINGKVGSIDSLTFDGAFSALIPSPAVKQLQGVLKEIDSVARIAVVGSSAYVFSDGFAFSTLLSGEKAPDADVRNLPRGKASVQMDRAATIKAIKSVAIGAARDARMRLRVGPKGITFRGQGIDASENERLVECDCGIASVSMAPEFMLDLLEFSRESTVTICMDPGDRKEGKSAGALTITEGDAVCAAMPIVYDLADLATDSPEWT